MQLYLLRYVEHHYDHTAPFNRLFLAESFEDAERMSQEYIESLMPDVKYDPEYDLYTSGDYDIEVELLTNMTLEQYLRQEHALNLKEVLDAEV